MSRPIDSELVSSAVDTVLENNPELVDAYYLDTHGALNDLTAEVMKEVNETISPSTAASALKARLEGKR